MTPAKEGPIAKAATKPTWISARAAYPLVLEICISPSYCGSWLAEKIAAGQIRQRVKNPNDAVEGFWNPTDPPSINFEDCSATALMVNLSGTAGLHTVTLFGLELAYDDLVAAGAMPTQPEEVEPKTWFDAAKKRFPRLRHESPTDYAKRLAPLMQDELGAKAWSEETLRVRLYDK